MYEDLVGSYEETALDILRYFGVAVPAGLTFAERAIQRQSDALNEEWARRYNEIRHRSPGY